MDNLQKYLQQMSLIKYRQSVVENIINNRTTTGYRYSDIEICVLQIRKIIELIAMGSLITNIEIYSEIHENYALAWNARLIFRDIERINPKFYPEPIVIDKSGKYDKFLPIDREYLTKEDAIKVYEKCGAILHVENPFRDIHDVAYYKRTFLFGIEKY